jgi:hypothetical protein
VGIDKCSIRAAVWEAEESPLLTSVIRKRLLKTMRAGEDLLFAVAICKLWRLAVALLINCSSESCVQVVNKSVHQSIPRL